MVTSSELYDNFAPYFRSYSKKKVCYIKTVDMLVLANLPEQINQVVDIGSGDGIRGKFLFERMGAKSLIMIDNSKNMVNLSRKYASSSIQVDNIDISGCLPKELEGKFDVVLCLWNVLGHVSSSEKRLNAIRNMKLMLSFKGKIFLDISNRYNIRYYGFKKVLYNISRDLFFRSDINGDFNYKIPINNKIALDSICHFFNPFEMRGLIKKADLFVENEISIDYSNGDIRKTFFGGHLFYILAKK